MDETPIELHAPFKGDLKPSRVSNKISNRFSELSNKPGKLIREDSIRATNHADIEAVIEQQNRGYRVYRSLRDNYGVHIPDVDFVIGNRRKSGYASRYTIVDIVEGSNIAESTLPATSEEKLNIFYSSIVDYYLDIYLNGGDYWKDFNNTQVVYGHRQGEIEDNVFIVDIDTSNIGIGSYDKNQKKLHNKILFEQLATVAYAITQAERNYSFAIKLIAARRRFLSKIAFIPDTDPDYNIISEAKKLLGD